MTNCFVNIAERYSFEKQKKTISIENKRINQSRDEHKTKQIAFRLKK